MVRSISHGFTPQNAVGAAPRGPSPRGRQALALGRPGLAWARCSKSRHVIPTKQRPGAFYGTYNVSTVSIEDTQLGRVALVPLTLVPSSRISAYS